MTIKRTTLKDIGVDEHWFKFICHAESFSRRDFITLSNFGTSCCPGTLGILNLALFSFPNKKNLTSKSSNQWAVRNRDGDSEYQMKVAELLLVAQYYGALQLGGSAIGELMGR